MDKGGKESELGLATISLEKDILAKNKDLALTPISIRDKAGQEKSLIEKEYIEYFQAYPAIFIMLIVLTWQFYPLPLQRALPNPI